MKPIIIILLLATIFSASGCATKYQRIGTDETGGYSSRRLGENRFEVAFHANGFTPANRAYDYAFLRAAEITLEYQYNFFSIEGEQSDSSSTVVPMGATTTTSGYVSPYGGYTGTSYTTMNSMPIYKPGYVIVISCFDRKPEGQRGKLYEAAEVIKEIKTKHSIR